MLTEMGAGAAEECEGKRKWGKKGSKWWDLKEKKGLVLGFEERRSNSLLKPPWQMS